nr:MAG TPA_asm: hypothetical protein [Caudoviricetes sp.]
MAGKVLHEDFASCFEVRPVHAKTDEPCAERIFFVFIVDILSLNALLADGLLVHQDGKLCESRQMLMVRCGWEASENDLFGGDFQTFQCRAMLCFITIDCVDEVHDSKSASVILQLVNQPLFHMEVSIRCFPDKVAAAVKKVDQITQGHTIMLADREGKFQIQRNFILLVFLLGLLFGLRLLCIQLLFRLILCCVIRLRCILRLIFHRFILLCEILGFGFLPIKNFRFCFSRLFCFRHRLCTFRLDIHALSVASQAFVQQARQQLCICIFRLDQQVAIPVDSVVADVVGVQRCFGVVRVDASQLLHASCEGLALGYIQFKSQHNPSLLFNQSFMHSDVLFGSTYIPLNRINSKAISRYSLCSTIYTNQCKSCCVNSPDM